MERIDGSVEHLGKLLERAVSRFPTERAVEDETGRAWSYSELDQEAGRLTSWFVGEGIGRGHRVGLYSPKALEGVAAIHAILRVGAAYVPADPTAPVGDSALN